MSVVKSDKYSIFDKLDENQIIAADKAVKQAMVYETKDGKREITFSGLKYIILEMSVHEQPIEIEENTVKLEKDDPDDKNTWHWRASVKVRNQKTNLPSQGLAESDYLEYGKYDSFGQRKAFSKAKRNAWREQIPEIKIVELLKIATGDQIQKVEVAQEESGTTNIKNQSCSCEEGKGQPNKDSKTCVACKGTFNTYQRKIIGLDK